MKSLVGEKFGKYQVSRLLGRGGMGEVYEAYDTDKGRSVALKVLSQQYTGDEKFRARFLRESRAAAVLQEPHVIPIHDWGEIDGTLYIDMRLVRGQTLHEMIEAGPLDARRAVDIIQQVAAALDAAHAEGLIHRDVKPQNIIVTPNDFAYLVDFGIAEARGEAHLTMTGYQVGTWHYMAPERFGAQEATAAVDVYSLACVLYEALTGHLPFPGQTQQVIAAHLTATPPRPSAASPSVPAALDEVVACGMAKRPGDRYRSAGALGEAARHALTAPAPPPTVAGTVIGPSGFGPPGGCAGYQAPAVPPVAVPPVLAPSSGQVDNSRTVYAVIGAVAAVLVAVVVGVTVAVVSSSDRDGGSTGPVTTVAYPSAAPTADSTESSAETQPPHTRRATPPTTTAAALPADQQLRQIATGDHAFVAAQLADRWVPQMSSKRPGVVDNGVVWDNAMTLQEHLQLRQQYGASLLWSGDWSTFSDSNFWVTVANVTYTNAAGALAWCASHGFDRDHCAAKIVSTTHPIAGSTAYN